MSERTDVHENYYFVLEPNGFDEGPYVLSEIRRRIELGLLTTSVALRRVGETEYLPVTSERYARYFEPPRRVATLAALTASINAAVTVVEPIRVVAATVARVKAAPNVEPVRAVGSAPMIEVAASAEPAMDTNASDAVALDAETTPVPRFEVDLIDAPTSLDPVSGTMLDASTCFEELAPTGRFDAVPSMMVDDAPAPVMRQRSRALGS